MNWQRIRGVMLATFIGASLGSLIGLSLLKNNAQTLATVIFIALIALMIAATIQHRRKKKI